MVMTDVKKLTLFQCLSPALLRGAFMVSTRSIFASLPQGEGMVPAVAVKTVFQGAGGIGQAVSPPHLALGSGHPHYGGGE